MFWLLISMMKCFTQGRNISARKKNIIEKVKYFQSWQKALCLFSLAFIATIVSCNGKAGDSIFASNPDDSISPVITTRGPMMIMEGEGHDSTFLTKGLKVTDNSGLVKLTIDSSQVKWNQQGTYKVVYTAKDSAQNVTTVTEELRVVGKNEKIIYLTFDDGPSVCTDQLLKILRDEKVKATFFVTAQFSHYLDRLGAIAKEGHEVVIHTYSHDFRIYKSIESYFEDLNKINDLIEKYTGKRSRILRHPGGSSNTINRKYNSDPKFMDKLCVALLDSGYQFVDWNLDSQDASGNNVPVSRLVSSACHTYHNVMCLLMHDTGAKLTTVQALPQIIHYFKQQGYEFGVLNSVDYVCWHGGEKKKERLNALRASMNAEKSGKASKAVPAAPSKPAAKAEVKPVEKPSTKSLEKPSEKKHSSDHHSSHDHHSKKDSEKSTSLKTDSVA